MKGEFFILGVFLFIFGMIILEVIYRAYRRTKGRPVPYTRVTKTFKPIRESEDYTTNPVYKNVVRTNIFNKK